MSTHFHHIGIIGAGTMGRGIALTCAIAGYQVTLIDTHEQALEKAKSFAEQYLYTATSKGRLLPEQANAVRDKLHFTVDFNALRNTQLTIESIIEDVTAKCELFTQLEELLPDLTILATNTSSISINSLARNLKYPTRFLGIHFFNPAHVMKLVELIPSFYTESNIITLAEAFVRSIGKQPVIVRDVPGFLVNRIVRNYYNEALRIVTECTASLEQVDTLLEGAGFRMGPFRLMDLIGIDTNLSVTKSVFEQYFFEPRYQPSRLQQNYVNAGLLGRKTGRGFYSSEDSTL